MAAGGSVSVRDGGTRILPNDGTHLKTSFHVTADKVFVREYHHVRRFVLDLTETPTAAEKNGVQKKEDE